MKILIVNTFDINGGAARAAYRLHNALIKFGIQSTMLVQKKFSTDSTVIEIKDKNNNSFYNNLILNNYPNKTKTLFSSSIINNKDLIHYINTSDADIVHLHWIVNNFLSTEDLLKIKKPIIWTLHDMWPFTGGCHYTEECEKYKSSCDECIVLNSNQQGDLSSINYELKQKVYKKLSNLTINAVSKWISNCAQESSLLKDKCIYNLPNPLDTNLFKPYTSENIREELNLPLDKKIILFGAMNATSDPRKGYKYLEKALNKLEKDKYTFLVFGNTEESKEKNITFLGNIYDDITLSKIYSCVDVMIVSSIQENLANTILESLSCGTPVVGFKIGGNSDMIDHKENGYLSKPFDTQDLADGIEWILHHPNYDELCKNARKKVLTNFSEEIVVPKYIKLYKKILKEAKSSKNNFKESSDIKLSNLYIKTFNKYIKEEKVKKELYFSKNFNKFFEQINSIDGNILLYGNGTIGRTIQKLIPEKIIDYVDIKDINHHPSTLKNMKYDKILISVLGREKEIEEYLLKELKINKNKIITIEL